MPEVIKIDIAQQSKEQEFLLCLTKKLGLTKVSYWRDSSGKIHLRLKKKLTLGTQHLLGTTDATPARTSVTLLAKVSFSWTPTLTEEFVLARAISAVADLPLLPSTEHDIAAEEWTHLQEELQELLDDHKLFKCNGLVNLQPCEDCQSLYGNPTRGGGLALRLARLDNEFRKGIQDDSDEFDPRAFTD